MWLFIKDQRTEQCRIASLKHNGTKCRDKATVLNNYFTSDFTKGDESHTRSLNGFHFPNILPINITIKKVISLLSNLNTHKASGLMTFLHAFKKSGINFSSSKHLFLNP